MKILTDKQLKNFLIILPVEADFVDDFFDFLEDATLSSDLARSFNSFDISFSALLILFFSVKFSSESYSSSSILIERSGLNKAEEGGEGF